MSLIIRRKAGQQGVSIGEGADLCMVRVVKIDPDGTVHLAFNAARSVLILREELTEQYRAQMRMNLHPRDYSENDNGNA